MHAAFEVAVAGEHGSGCQVAGFHCGGDFGFEGAAVANAIMNTNGTGHEGAEVVDGKVEHRASTGRAYVCYLQRESWERQRLLVHAIATRLRYTVVSRAQSCKPLACTDLLQ